MKGMDKSIIEKAYKKELDKLIHDSNKIYGASEYCKMCLGCWMLT